MDPAYYLEREQAERLMAEQSANERARTIHLELADRYRALAETYARAGPSRLRAA
jgi:hypothetical protein